MLCRVEFIFNRMFTSWSGRHWFLCVLGIVLSSISSVAWGDITLIMQAGNRSWWPGIGLMVAVLLAVFVMMLVWPKRWNAIPGVLIVGALALWVRDWREIVFLLIGWLFLWHAVRQVKRDLASRLVLAPYRSMAVGAASVATSLVFLLSVHYYFQVYRLPWQEVLPRFSLGQESTGIMLRFVGSFNPNVQKVVTDQTTLDMFLVGLVEGQTPNQVAEVSDSTIIVKSMTVAAQQASLAEGRKRFESLAGMPLLGTESVVNVFSRIIEYQTRSFFDPVTRGYPPDVLPFVLSFLLFLTLLPVAYVVRMAALWLATGLFWLCVRLKLVKIGVVTVEKEVIEE